MRKLNKYDHVSVLPKWIDETNQELEILKAMQRVIDDRIKTFEDSIKIIEQYSNFANGATQKDKHDERKN